MKLLSKELKIKVRNLRGTTTIISKYSLKATTTTTTCIGTQTKKGEFLLKILLYIG